MKIGFDCMYKFKLKALPKENDWAV